MPGDASASGRLPADLPRAQPDAARLIAAVIGVALLSVFVFFSASQPAFACSTIWTPEPTASPTAGATPNLGYAQPDMGNNHVTGAAR